MQLKRTYARDKQTGKMVETTPAKVRALLKGIPKRRVRRGGAPMMSRPQWPMVSDSLSVRPKMAKQTMERLAKEGCPVEINSQGQFVFTSRSHRNQVLKHTGYLDRSAGYGDYAGK